MNCGAQADEESVGSAESALCAGVRLSSDASGPVNASVTLQASLVNCAAGETPEYRFMYRRDGTTQLIEIQGWSPSATASWNTQGLPSGSYRAFVYARATGSPKQQSYSSLGLLVGQVCDSVSLSSDLTSPQSIGAVVALNASATCNGGNPEYRFTAKPAVGDSVVLQDWSDAAQVSWNTAGLGAGPYALSVAARAVGNLATEAQRALPFRLGETCTVSSVTTTPPSPGALGNDVTVSADASCTGSVTPEFRFWYRPSAAKTYVLLRDFSGAASTVWHTSGLPADNYSLMVETRASDYAGRSLGRKLTTFIVGPACSGLTFVSSPKSPPPLDAVIQLTAGATCSSGAPEYRFSVKAPGAASYSELRGWGTNTASFDSRNQPGGEYSFKVEMRGIGNIAAFQAQRALSYDLGRVCNKVSATASPPSPGFPGTNVLLTGAATCVNGGAAEYQFSARALGTTPFTLIRDWGPATTSWNTAAPPWNSASDYQVRVSARGQGQIGPAESNRILDYSLQTGCLAGSLYDITIQGAYTEKIPSDPEDNVSCDVYSGVYQRSLQAVVAGNTVEVTGHGFDGIYPIVAATAGGFTAQAGSLYAPGFDCGDFYPGADNSGLVTLDFNCATKTVAFSAICQSDASADGCFPNYYETANGSGTRSLLCDPGYKVSAGQCVDIDECAGGSPCSGKETCTNTVGSFSCSCELPARSCNGACVDTASDVSNCGACGVTCADGERCEAGTCLGLTCPKGYAAVGGVCVDVNECTASPSPCDANAVCTNTPGSYSCACKRGFTGNGVTCTDIDECLTEPCWHYLMQRDATCTNLPGSYECTCDLPAVACHGWDCWDLSTDSSNCGACGHVCASNQTCEAGVCVAASCPGSAGPSMVALPSDNGDAYCIDSTEVTRAQYAAWLATTPATSSQDAVSCGWNNSYVPSCLGADTSYWPPGNNGNKPVVCVDWCDAVAYCKDAGKRLCGSPVAGPAPYLNPDNVTASQWFNACTAHGQYAYLYGSKYLAGACNESGFGAGAMLDVGSIATCQSPSLSFNGVYDLLGNASEWDDSCDSSSPTSACHARGGSYSDVAGCTWPRSLLRSVTSRDVGFRCCADL
ncbi:MAG TPA: SUMF1/EgtB/PvdO family nonheme iron enzyme [Polyangiaceae bacterium]|nr:SUMF1/EgtB/PvdO family nonheme iron enzyme [Polyangiaceae bacterium]